MKRREYLAGGIGLAGVVGGAAYVTLGGSSLGKGTTVDAVSVETLKAKESSAGQLSIPITGSVTILDMFSVSCIPCREQLANLQTAFSQVGQGVQFVSLTPESLVDGSDTAEVIEFWDEYGGSWTMGLDPDNHFTRSLNVESYPYTAVFDKDRTLRFEEVGVSDPDEIVEIVESAKSD